MSFKSYSQEKNHKTFGRLNLILYLSGMEKIYDKLEERKRVLKWLISGLGIHGLKISDAKYITWGWVIKNYNIPENQFNCKHISVSDIGLVITSEGKEYDGFCNACEKTVHGIIRNDGTKERWK